MALLFAGTLVWRFPATTSTWRGGSAARSVLAEKGTSAAAGAVDLAGFGSRFGGTGAEDAAGVLLLSLLRLLRTVASCSSPLGGNKKSSSPHPRGRRWTRGLPVLIPRQALQGAASLRESRARNGKNRLGNFHTLFFD